ncbi:uncharacterized protein Z518_03248 [Rhinocladiella mackenziei CBS 650.93]|uniref:Uncharacterized protein n=1 Tax=Rhinocladiella mackenziei CBS 650.93 TaxID=1442369 RepID=A0A0D2G267_9EURO|nr:uncharacterized protein Z518_03248 [Rhinocladiella mackenziei CBS 650.93]KIX08592.1 hypothetical protein Z518_03248 [Rhinocladiella mackenziei CBS 650.93]
MLFAWADDVIIQKKITTLNTTDQIKAFFSSQKNVIFVDQMNAFKIDSIHGPEIRNLHDWWWERHKGLATEDYRRERFEDITGRIPLLLDKCVVRGNIDLDVPELRDIYSKSAGFVQQVKGITKKSDLNWKYCDYVTSCFQNQAVPPRSAEHLEPIYHRYFYHNDEEIGGYTCGLVRKTMTDQLLERGRNFLGTDFLASMSDFNQ